MNQFMSDFFGYVVFFYTLALVSSYIAMAVLAYLHIRKHRSVAFDPILRSNIEKSPYTPGVSIVAGAYNEENIVIECVESFLRQNYPIFEVIIVNDGSKDKTLELMIEHFELEEVPYVYIERIHTKPFKRLFRSRNPHYHRLTVVDKVNGGTKADAINAGLNVVQYPYFINTDVDCILSKDAIFQCIRPILERNDVIAVSGAMALNNGCEIENGEITRRDVSMAPAPWFQSVEYLRSFILAKMAWSQLNAMPNVSGGYGLFDTSVVIGAGGYNPTSFAEDMDLVIRMIGHMCDTKRPYHIVQIPETCCWTQAPPTLKVLYKQRVRWGRGLIQTFVNYMSMIFNKNYRRLGLITLPYILIFEFLAPVIEFSGMCMTLYWAFTGAINWDTFFVMFGSIVTFNYVMATITCYYDMRQGGTYGSNLQSLKLMLAAILEPLFYHPMIVVFSLNGYFNYIISKQAKWGNMTRKKYTSSNANANATGAPPGEAGNIAAAPESSPTPPPTDSPEPPIPPSEQPHKTAS